MEGVLKEASSPIMHHRYANEVVHCRAISTAVLSTAYVAAQLSCSRPTYWDPTNHQISEIRYLYGPGRARIQTKSLLSSTINIHITQRFVRCTAIPRMTFITPSMTGVLRKPSYSEPVRYVLRPRPLKRFVAACHHPPIYQHFGTRLSRPRFSGANKSPLQDLETS
jgi:hypothetical protein